MHLRREALDEYGVLGTPPEPAFDDISRMASIALEVPIALVSLGDGYRRWLKSSVGLDLPQSPWSSSMCEQAVSERGIVEIEDLRLDPRTAEGPFVTGAPGLRFYAAAVLRTSEDIAVGTVCVMDHRPRTLTQPQREMLLGLARQTMALLELRRSLLRADAFEQGQSHFIAVAGHDLRQPLQIITGTVELSLALTDSDRIKKHLRNALQAVERMVEEVDTLTKSGLRNRASAGPVKLVEFPIGELIGALTPAWKEEAARKGLRLDVQPSSAPVRTDRRLMSSILGNLVGNAIKYTNSGRIVVGCRRRPDAHLELLVMDTGIGLSAENRDVIFTPFKQINAASDGLGLGLSLVKQAADYLDYKIKVRSVVGAGSCFSFLIPIAAASDPSGNRGRPGSGGVPHPNG